MRTGRGNRGMPGELAEQGFRLAVQRMGEAPENDGNAEDQHGPDEPERHIGVGFVLVRLHADFLGQIRAGLAAQQANLPVELVAQGFQAIITNINAADFDPSFCDIVKSWDELDKGRFCTSGSTDDTDSLSGLNMKINVFQR